MRATNRRISETASHPRAFTLVELVVAVAIALVLTIAVGSVFRMTSDTIGAGQALGGVVRDSRAVQTVIASDLSGAVLPYGAGASTLEDGPFLLIRSERLTMFRTRNDQVTDRDGDVYTLDFNANNTEGEPNVPGEVVRHTDVNGRSHRLDRLMFFGRGLFGRQTGGDVASGGRGPFVADMSGHEAFVWYGHLRLPDPTTPSGDARGYVSRLPGEVVPPASPSQPQPANALNFYAADWALGRMVVMLIGGEDTNSDGVGDVLTDRHGTPQVYLRRTTRITDGTSVAPLHGRFRNRRVLSSDGADQWELEWSRYDVANTSIAQFREIVQRYGRQNVTFPWHVWFSGLRFEADPHPGKPLTAAGVARTGPILLSNCAHFIVEYAGDFVTQDSDPIRGSSTPEQDGTVLRVGPDGAVDFIVLPDGSRQTRWYGLPRDTSGDGLVPGGRAHNNEMPDVVPLRDVRRTARDAPPAEAAPFERFENVGGQPPLPLPATGDYATSLPAGASYTVAWGPDTADEPRPRMLRIVISLDDPRDRLAAPQTYPFIFRLP